MSSPIQNYIMLTITINGVELWNEISGEFEYTKDETLRLEHSLFSISKWEAKWCKPFIESGEEQKTEDEAASYIQCMDLDEPRDISFYSSLPDTAYEQINIYLSESHTASTVKRIGGSSSDERVTSELIYYWMVGLTIPPEYQYWPLDRLLILIEICNIKNQPPKKMSQQEILKQNHDVNEARLKKYNTTG